MENTYNAPIIPRMRAYAPKVDLLDTSGQHLRYVPGQLAQAMVAAEHAVIAAGNGRVKAIKLTATIEGQARRVGAPQAVLPLNTKFTRRVKTDSGCTWIEHHPRSFDR